MYRECELKFKIENEDEKRKLQKQAETLGFSCVGRGMETDFTPDVEGFLCRKNGVLIRFRQLDGEDGKREILVTMKIKGPAQTFQEYFEMEYLFSSVDREIVKKINERLQQVAGRMLPESLHETGSFEELVKRVKAAGFSEHRMLLQKKRETYAKGSQKITFDFLPEGIGWYAEIEVTDPGQLSFLVNAMGLGQAQAEKENYGAILKAHKKGLPDQEARTGLFTNESL